MDSNNLSNGESETYHVIMWCIYGVSRSRVRSYRIQKPLQFCISKITIQTKRTIRAILLLRRRQSLFSLFTAHVIQAPFHRHHLQKLVACFRHWRRLTTADNPFCFLDSVWFSVPKFSPSYSEVVQFRVTKKKKVVKFCYD